MTLFTCEEGTLFVKLYSWGLKSLLSQFLKAILKIVERFPSISKVYHIFPTQCVSQREFRLDVFGLC